MKWKVCGMRDRENIFKAAALKPDFMGFIFYKKSERYVQPKSLQSILPNLDDNVKKVGVFVNEEIDTVLNINKLLSLDYVQLHGEESVAYIENLANSGLKIIKAFHIDDKFEWSDIMPYGHLVSFFLFDTKGAKYGGNGYLFDWNLLSNYTLDIPYFLSGGLDLLAVEAAMQHSLPNLAVLDVNSRFEVSPGNKNIELLKKLKNQIIHE